MRAIHVLSYAGKTDDGPDFDVTHPPACPSAPVVDDQGQVVYWQHKCATEWLLADLGWNAFVTPWDVSIDELPTGLYLTRVLPSDVPGEEAWPAHIEILRAVEAIVLPAGAV